MASAAGTTGTALLFSFAGIVFTFLLLQAPGLAVADLVRSALDRVLDGRGGLMELATRRNMILLCNAILLLILRDAGVLGAPARRRSRSLPGEAATATTIVAQTAAPAPAPTGEATAAAAGTEIIACSAAAPAPARPHATSSAVVWRRRRPRNRAVVVAPMHEHDAAGRVVVECQPAAETAATWAAPALTTGPPEQKVEEAAAAVATKQIVVVESPRNDDGLVDRHDRAAVVEPLEYPTAIAVDSEKDDCDDRRIITVATAADDVKRTDDQTAGMEAEMEMELADDRTFEEFIQSQRRQMRQESLQLFRSDYQYEAIATRY